MNYSEIKALALNYADRADDTEVVASFDNMLKIVEAKLNRVLQVKGQTKRAYIATEAGKAIYTLPPDFAGMRTITVKANITDNSGTIGQYRTPEMFSAEISGETFIYTMFGDVLQVNPTYDAQYFEILYYSKVTPLNSGIMQNFIGDSYPDAYIFGLLVEISAFVKDFESATAWDSRFRQVLDEMDFESSQDQWSSPSLQVRVL
jgi:hypothetical protein